MSELDASERGRRIIEAIIDAGRRLGLDVVTEHPVPGGRIDVAWLWRPPVDLPGDVDSVVLAAFEVESSWRSRKHVKGDYLNLCDVGAALGVIVLAGEGPEIESLRKFAERLVARPGPRVMIWSEAQVEALRHADIESRLRQESPEPAADGRSANEHTGKYRALWEWLTSQDASAMTLTFLEIEEVMGMSLPPSCRDHAAHWYSHQGSAVARAILDAGWRASAVDLLGERVTLARQSPGPPAGQEP